MERRDLTKTFRLIKQAMAYKRRCEMWWPARRFEMVPTNGQFIVRERGA